jgi:hypothetical protein
MKVLSLLFDKAGIGEHPGPARRTPLSSKGLSWEWYLVWLPVACRRATGRLVAIQAADFAGPAPKGPPMRPWHAF